MQRPAPTGFHHSQDDPSASRQNAGYIADYGTTPANPACLDDEDAVPGVVGFLQSSGELLSFHPHVHVLVTDGGFCPDGTFLPLGGYDSSLVERIFRGEVLRMLTDRG